MTAASSIECRGFGHRPPGRRAWALRDIDLTVAAGEHVLLLGASGAGKSTLLRAIAGLLDDGQGGSADRNDGTNTEGTVRVDGAPSFRGNPRVGLLLQDPDAHLLLSRMADDVAFGLRTRGVAPQEAARRAAAALEAVGLTSVELNGARRVATLSGGERQRVALAGVLATNPGVMLLDEPTSMLDPDGAALVRASVSRLARDRGVTLIVVEHRVTEWLPLVDRVVVLRTDGIAADGPPAQVLSDRSLITQGVWLPVVTDNKPSARPAGPRLLTADQVSLQYPGAATPALADLTMCVSAGTATALTGPNGSGKSTAALLLGGLARPSGGAVHASPQLCAGVSETRPHRWPSRDLAQRIGTVFQNPEHAFVRATAAEELAAGPRARGRSGSQVDDVVDTLLERTHLRPLAEANPYTLSGGQQRRLSVAAALATAPRLLVLDEPTFGQDPNTWLELVELLRERCDAGVGLVFATHDEPFVAALADARVRLVAGRCSPEPS